MNPKFEGNNKEWEWIQQARIVYNHIRRTPTCNPPTKLFNVLETKNQIISHYNHLFANKNVFMKQNFTIPITTTPGNLITKTKAKTWWDNVEVTFDNKNFYKNKINQKLILNEMYKRIENAWTKSQKHFISQNIPLEDFFTKKLNTFEKINDFRIKFALNFWGESKSNCLCGKSFSLYHFLTECQIIFDWLKLILYDPDRLLFALFQPGNKVHLHAWIINWCAWKTYNKEIKNPIENGLITINSLNFSNFLKIMKKCTLFT